MHDAGLLILICGCRNLAHREVDAFEGVKICEGKIVEEWASLRVDGFIS